MTETLGLTEPLLQTPYSSSSSLNHFTLSLSTVFVLYAGLLPLPLPPRIPPLTHSSLFFSNIHNLRMQRFSLFLFSHYQNFPQLADCCCCFCCSPLLLFSSIYRTCTVSCSISSTLVVALPQTLLLLLHHSSQRFLLRYPHTPSLTLFPAEFGTTRIISSKQCQIAVQRCVSSCATRRSARRVVVVATLLFSSDDY